jgi:hypothetical protein
VTWYRSLYWRIAFGVVGLIAAMLIVQAMLFVWAVSQTGRTLPGQSPGRLGLTVALDLANELGRDPKVDLTRYVHDQYASYTHPFFVMMADGTLITSGSQSFPESLLRMSRARLQGPPPRFGRFDGSRPEGPRPDRDPIALNGGSSPIASSSGSIVIPPAARSFAPHRSSSTASSQASSSFRRRRRSGFSWDALPRSSASSRPPC